MLIEIKRRKFNKLFTNKKNTEKKLQNRAFRDKFVVNVYYFVRLIEHLMSFSNKIKIKFKVKH